MDAPSRLACWSIAQYQRFVSPHKGFRCAHAVVHGGTSCSGAVRDLVTRLGVAAALRPTLARFAACRAAYLAMPALGYHGSQVEGVCCCGGIPIPFKF